jgi:phosphoglycolate phosphatase-like HAD superfamily hydrolase
LNPWITIILGADSVPLPKPAPDAALKACVELRIDPSEAIVVGDSTKDILMGRAAGMRTCAALFHEVGRDDVLAVRPDFTISNLSELPALLP